MCTFYILYFVNSVCWLHVLYVSILNLALECMASLSAVLLLFDQLLFVLSFIPYSVRSPSILFAMSSANFVKHPKKQHQNQQKRPYSLFKRCCMPFIAHRQNCLPSWKIDDKFCYSFFSSTSLDCLRFRINEEKTTTTNRIANNSVEPSPNSEHTKS